MERSPQQKVKELTNLDNGFVIYNPNNADHKENILETGNILANYFNTQGAKYSKRFTTY